jgi:hypothetical protein
MRLGAWFSADWPSIERSAMNATSDQLASAAVALCVHSPHSFTIFGSRYEVSDQGAELERESVLNGAARALLAEILYTTLHCRRPAGGSSAPADWPAQREFIHSLSAANTGSASWQSGWIVKGFETDGRVVAEKYGIRFWVPRCDFHPVSVPTRVGDASWVRVPKEYCGLQPGFYLALGDAGDADGDGSETLRVYWHLWSGGAARLVESLTRRLNEAGVPFALKLLAVPNAYPRSDAGVLYISPLDYQEIIPLLSRTYREVRPWLRQPISAFAKEIAPGLGLAEDFGDGSSFGQHRCSLLAAELTRPGMPSAGAGLERFRAVVGGLRRAGWDPERLYLNPGQPDHYPPLDLEELGADR